MSPWTILLQLRTPFSKAWLRSIVKRSQEQENEARKLAKTKDPVEKKFLLRRNRPDPADLRSRRGARALPVRDLAAPRCLPRTQARMPDLENAQETLAALGAEDAPSKLNAV